MRMIGKLATSLIVGGTMLAASAPADAQRWRGNGYYNGFNGGGGFYGRGYRNRGSRTGLALGAGAVGLALGAALASNNRGGYYDRGYYGPRGYAYGPRRFRPRCYTERVWDDYAYRWRRVRFCD